MSYLTVSMYSADYFEIALKQIFDNDSNILDCSYVIIIEVKIELLIITVFKTSSCIFINYNDVKNRSQDCDTLLCYFTKCADFWESL